MCGVPCILTTAQQQRCKKNRTHFIRETKTVNAEWDATTVLSLSRIHECISIALHEHFVEFRRNSLKKAAVAAQPNTRKTTKQKEFELNKKKMRRSEKNDDASGVYTYRCTLRTRDLE